MPATLLLVLVPYLTNVPFLDLKTLILALTLVLIHYFSFGHNSLMDYVMGYDQRDHSKSHFPLNRGVIRLTAAHNVIHWGLSLLTVWSAFLTVWISPNPFMAITCLLFWVAFGQAYNDGLSKESPLGFLAISVCSTASGMWGWFLSHVSLDSLGAIFSGYVFLTILFQISYSGFLKELEVGERSNILTRMGARIEVLRYHKIFRGGRARFYGWFIKVFNLILGWSLWYLRPSVAGLVTLVILSTIALIYLHKLTKPRTYERKKELMAMSIEEICTIYIPLFVLLSPLEALVLASVGIIYFFGINKWIWGVSHPAV